MDYSGTAVIIPCYNEALTISKVVDDFHRELPGALSMFTTTTRPMTLHRSPSSTGLRCATRPKAGPRQRVPPDVQGYRCRVLPMVDGDDTYPAEAAKSLCNPILTGEADMTIGDRLSNGTYAEENKRAFHGFGSNLVRTMIRVDLRLRL